MLKVSQIGLGNWGKRFLPVLNKLANVVICANHSGEDGRSWLKREYSDIRHTFVIDDIINDASLKAVFITSPIETHYKITKQCLVAGKNVFVEKPMAMSKQEVNELYSVASDNNLALVAGYIYTYNPILIHIKEIISSDPINTILMQWEKYGTFKENILWNLVSHELSILYNLMGPSVNNIEWIDKIGKVTDLDALLIKLYYDNNRNGIIIINRMSTTKRKSILIRTESGRVFIWENDKLFEYHDKKGYIELFTDGSNILEIELRSFIGSIETNIVNYDEKEMNAFITEIINELIILG